MDVAVIGAAAAVVGIPIGLSQWLSARAQARSAEVELLRSMRSDWQALKPQWHRAILTAIGPDSYYSPARLEVREGFRRLVAAIVAEPARDDPNRHAWRDDIRERSHEFEQAERDVLFFLATLASVVFQGRLSPGLAYTVVGPDVVRRSRQIRVLLGEAPPAWNYASEEEKKEAADGAAAMSAEELELVVLAAANGEIEIESAQCPWEYWV